jgi:hypothetical protein
VPAFFLNSDGELAFFLNSNDRIDRAPRLPHASRVCVCTLLIPPRLPNSWGPAHPQIL